MFESPLYGRHRSLVEVAFLFFGLAGLPVFADPAAPAESSNPAGITSLSEEELEAAVQLQCSGEAYRVLITSDGQAFLQFYPEHPDRLQELPLSEPVNPAKTTIVCGEGFFSLRSSPPFSNRLLEQRFLLSLEKAAFSSKREYDPTEQLLEEAVQLVFSGNREALKSLDFSGIEFAYQYVNAERIQRLINEANSRCNRQPCKPLIENTFLLITRLSSAVSGNERNPSSPIQWIQALDDLGVSVIDATPLLLRYTEILRPTNRKTEAIQMLDEMARRDVESPELHLLYGDLLWESGMKDKALIQYRAFAELISREGKSPPERIARLLSNE